MTRNTPSEASTTEQGRRTLAVSRVIDAAPDRLYRAFVDPDELAEWMHPPGFEAEVHHLEPVEGGTYRITMAGEAEGDADGSHTYGGTYRELVPGARIVQTEAPEVADPAMAGEMTVTVTFEEVADGTEVTVALGVPEGWPDGAIHGWEAALGNLAGLLEAA